MKATGESVQNARRRLPRPGSRNTCRLSIWVLRRSAQDVKGSWQATTCQLTSRRTMMVLERNVPTAQSSLSRNIWMATSNQFTSASGRSALTAQKTLLLLVWVSTSRKLTKVPERANSVHLDCDSFYWSARMLWIILIVCPNSRFERQLLLSPDIIVVQDCCSDFGSGKERKK